jgi:hypothetical protein
MQNEKKKKVRGILVKNNVQKEGACSCARLNTPWKVDLWSEAPYQEMHRKDSTETKTEQKH